MPKIKLMFFFASPSFLWGSSPPWAPFWSNRGSDLWDLEYLKALTKYVKRWTHPPALAKDLKFIVLHRRSFVISFQSLSASCKVNKFLKFGHVSCTYSRCHPCFHTSTASSMHYNSNHQNASAGVKVYKLRRAAPPASPRKPSVPNVSCFFTLTFLWAPSCFFWFVLVGFCGSGVLLLACFGEIKLAMAQCAVHWWKHQITFLSLAMTSRLLSNSSKEGKRCKGLFEQNITMYDYYHVPTMSTWSSINNPSSLENPGIQTKTWSSKDKNCDNRIICQFTVLPTVRYGDLLLLLLLLDSKDSATHLRCGHDF